MLESQLAKLSVKNSTVSKTSKDQRVHFKDFFLVAESLSPIDGEAEMSKVLRVMVHCCYKFM